MIKITKGNLLKAPAEALVNTVNTVGVMGKGIALQFRQAYPENYKAYRKAVDAGSVRPGHMFVFQTGLLNGPRYIINFPTKRHWKGKSRIEDIESGLRALAEVVKERHIKTVAMPPLGSGLGGLHWPDVRRRIEDFARELPDVSFTIFEPRADAADTDAVKPGGEPPRM